MPQHSFICEKFCNSSTSTATLPIDIYFFAVLSTLLILELSHFILNICCWRYGRNGNRRSGDGHPAGRRRRHRPNSESEAFPGSPGGSIADGGRIQESVRFFLNEDRSHAGESTEEVPIPEGLEYETPNEFVNFPAPPPPPLPTITTVVPKYKTIRRGSDWPFRRTDGSDATQN